MKVMYRICIVLGFLAYGDLIFALRNPFSCAHKHGAVTEQPKQKQPIKKASKSKLTQAAVDDGNISSDEVSSEWRMIAEKDGAVIMQHRDGSIREITMQ